MAVKTPKVILQCEEQNKILPYTLIIEAYLNVLILHEQTFAIEDLFEHFLLNGFELSFYFNFIFYATLHFLVSGIIIERIH